MRDRIPLSPVRLITRSEIALQFPQNGGLRNFDLELAANAGGLVHGFAITLHVQSICERTRSCRCGPEDIFAYDSCQLRRAVPCATIIAMEITQAQRDVRTTFVGGFPRADGVQHRLVSVGDWRYVGLPQGGCDNFAGGRNFHLSADATRFADDGAADFACRRDIR
jgi:hypothetical protein